MTHFDSVHSGLGQAALAWRRAVDPDRVQPSPEPERLDRSTQVLSPMPSSHRRPNPNFVQEGLPLRVASVRNPRLKFAATPVSSSLLPYLSPRIKSLRDTHVDDVTHVVAKGAIRMSKAWKLLLSVRLRVTLSLEMYPPFRFGFRQELGGPTNLFDSTARPRQPVISFRYRYKK
ncbi:hypothetical protein PtA15_11A151 [Puccinia triticina]|uniref:Uncharacterized protein n=1 Tax=Puccinia triticina TaxID=208348 RepID=A0ABY7CX07_9BASI|nr:uncharacterized protein PtA15_11A151 [Puccinia triticina]WAQ89463.1 hypothetical protein PtA15_11A151 [Puccinia triticina]